MQKCIVFGASDGINVQQLFMCFSAVAHVTQYVKRCLDPHWVLVFYVFNNFT